MIRNLRILLPLSVVLVAGAFWVGRASAPGRDEKPQAAQASVDSNDAKSASASLIAHGAAVAGVSQGVAQPAQAQPLPPPGTPVAAMHDELAARARAGDVQAACRLGTELARCRSEQRLGATTNFLKKSMAAHASNVSDASIDVLATLQNKAEDAGALCDGVTEQQMAEAIEFQRRAAERGDARMRLWYATYPALDKEFFLRDFDEWQRYREVALHYIQQALEAGVPEAPAVLAQVHEPSNGMFSPTQTPLRMPDSHLYFVYGELASMLSPSEADKTLTLPEGAVDLTPKPGPDIDMAQVRAEAERLRQKWYSGYAPTAADPPRGLAQNDPQSICGQ